jgi:cytoskeleton protein RodZ
VDIVDAEGRRVEHGLIAAGSERRYAAGQASRILLGDAEAVHVSLDGRAVDLAPYREANIVRFTVSSQGRITPPGG